MRVSRILVGVDHSAPGRSAFDQALALSRTHGAALIAVHAVPAKRPFSWRASQRSALLKSLRAEAKAAGVRFTASVQHGNPAGVILLHAVSRRPDLIVVGTHQRTGLERLRAGSVAERVAIRAEQPVLVVPSHVEKPARQFETIVAAVDFSKASDNAVEQAATLAARTRAALTLVHVVPGSLAVSTPDALYPGALEYQRLLVQDAWRRLQESTPEVALPDRAAYARVLTGDPATEIARFSASIHADLVVVGLTRRGAISRAVFGTTAARLLRMTAQPVLIVPEDHSLTLSRRDRVAHTDSRRISRGRDRPSAGAGGRAHGSGARIASRG
jgi:nucleotide-binding universal stress UspA family protein